MRVLTSLLVTILFLTFSTFTSAQKNARMYTVVAKDNLNKIAKQYNVSVKELQKLNKLKGDKIFKGQVLAMPTKDVHIVSKGETLYEIGEMYDLSSKELKSYNNLSSNTISPNQKIRLRSMSVNVPKAIPTAASFTAKGGEVFTFKHVVTPKENLYRIANRYGLAVSDMRRVNNIKGDAISIGQELVLPLQTHKVLKNETLSEIAKQHKVNMVELKKINNLKGSMIRRGSVLLIPG